jgi:acyl-CoA thioesterase
MAKKYIQYNLFDKPEVIKGLRGRKKLTPWERKTLEEGRERKKKLMSEMKFEAFWKARGLVQGYMFDEDGNIICR